jgi:ATP-dependent Clp protease ATP-binding subunit ClpC
LNAVTHSAELEQVLAQARDIAAETGQALSSAHVLLALYTVSNLAELLLLDERIDEERLLSCIDRMEPEPPDTVARLADRCRQLAAGCDQPSANCLHLLAAIARTPRSFAYRVLERADVKLASLRTTALRYATQGVPPRLLRQAPARAQQGTSTEPDTVETPALGGSHHHPARTADRAVVVERVASAPQPMFERREGDRRRQQRGRRATDRASDRGVVIVPPKRGEKAPPPDEDTPSPYVLNRERFPWLTQLGRNLSHLAWLGRLDPVVGRDAEIQQAIDILHKRRSNNPCLLGDPGVGKTAIAEGIAERLVDDEKARGQVPQRVIIQIDVGAILAGTHLRGSLAERLRGLQDEVRRADGAVIIFIDELHTLIGAGSGDGAHDAANELKAALARGQFPCIGATTLDEFRKHVESDPALERRFTPLVVEEPDEATTRHILEGVVDRYAEHHGVTYAADAIEAAVRLGRRYLHERRDPDRALGVLDLAGAVARRAGGVVDRRAVAEVISRTARVPLEHLMVDDPKRFLEMEAHLAQRIVGQRHALSAVAETIRRNFAGFAGRRPIGSFLFLGPTGVGKTEAVKALAAFLFGTDDALVRFDMSEYLESHSLARLIGAPPGYVGFDDGGQLTEALRRRPYQVVLFDEIEKSHRDVWNVLLQVLDEGRLTDGKGRTVDFTNAVIVLTSNLGADLLEASEPRRIGFAADARPRREAFEARVLEKARGAFPPELWNRIESRLVFHPLEVDEIRSIARLILRDRARLLATERGIDFTADDAAIDVLIAHGGFDARLGARPMRQIIGREVEAPLAEGILAGRFRRGDHVRIGARDGALFFESTAT